MALCTVGIIVVEEHSDRAWVITGITVPGVSKCLITLKTVVRHASARYAFRIAVVAYVVSYIPIHPFRARVLAGEVTCKKEGLIHPKGFTGRAVVGELKALGALDITEDTDFSSDSVAITGQACLVAGSA